VDNEYGQKKEKKIEIKVIIGVGFTGEKIFSIY